VPRRYPWVRVLLPFAWVIGFTLLALVSLPIGDLGPLDKVLHAGVTCGAVLLFAWGAGNKSRSVAFLIFLGGLILIYSYVIEFVQDFIPERSFNIYDFLANTIGIALGICILSRVRKEKRGAGK